MERDYIPSIVHRYFAGDYPADMQEKLQAWLIGKEKASLKEEAMLEIWSELKTTHDDSVYSSLREVKQKLGLEAKKQPPKRYGIIFSLAAAILLLLIVGRWYYSSAPAEWVHITTAYGETARCVLPDSSFVWISPGSTISYHKTFKGDSREVRLCGEARFRVTKEERKPFTVRTATCTVQVLGTLFQLSDYPEDQQAIARLEEGKIEVSPSPGKTYALSPRQKITIDKTTRAISILPTRITDWEEGALVFEDIPLADIFQALKRHYGVQLVYRDFRPADDRYSIKFHPEETLEQALDLLQTLTENFIWSKHNNQIIIRSWNPSHTD